VTDWLTPKDAAGVLGVSVKTVRRLYESGELPAFKVCARVQIRREDAAAYLESCRVEPRKRVHNGGQSGERGLGLRAVLAVERQGD
jgi:excisionase family DNA binding protein